MGSAMADKFLKHALADMAGAKSSRESRQTCVDCGEEIPARRRKAMAGCQRCVDCQTEFEGGGDGS